MKKIFVMTVCVVLAGCISDAGMSQLTSLGSTATITCYSGGVEIYKGKSTGKVMTETSSDGWFFREEGSGNLIRVSADCVIRN